MAFGGCCFTYDGISCGSFGLMLYDIEEAGSDGDVPVSSISIVDEIVGSRWRPLFYKTKHEEKLQFELIFGLSTQRIDANQPLTRSEIAEISSWISGHETYKWLEFEENGAEDYRFRCIITKLDVIEYGKSMWAFRANVVCDSHFAYMRPKIYKYQISGAKEITITNEGSLNGYYYPTVSYRPNNGGSFHIQNISDNNRCLSFRDIPTGVTELAIDNENAVITCNNGINMYQYFNFKFLRLKKGENRLRIEGDGEVKITCVYPVSIGC